MPASPSPALARATFCGPHADDRRRRHRDGIRQHRTRCGHQRHQQRRHAQPHRHGDPARQRWPGLLTLTNTGTINKTGAGTFVLGSSPVPEHVTLTNSGTINVNAGTPDHMGGTLTQSGLIEVLAGATFSKPGGFFQRIGWNPRGRGRLTSALAIR